MIDLGYMLGGLDNSQVDMSEGWLFYANITPMHSFTPHLQGMKALLDCHGTTSLLSFLIFVCPLPHLHHLPTPSDLICLPSTTSAPTPRCTHATMLCLHLD